MLHYKSKVGGIRKAIGFDLEQQDIDARHMACDDDNITKHWMNNDVYDESAFLSGNLITQEGTEC